jgi:MFS family permease
LKTQKLKGIMGLLALSLVMFIVTLDTTITNIALPTVTDYFHTSLTTTNWISTVYVLVLSVFIIPASKLADQFGRKKVMLIGLVAFGLGSALCGMSQSIQFLILMRILQGLGGAIVTPVMIPLSVEAFGRENAGKAVGIIGAVTAIAAAGGPPIGGLIIKYLNWQSIFYVNVPIVIITFILICISFAESYDNTISKRVDWFGMIFLSGGLFQLTFVLIKGYTYGWTSRPIVLLIIGAVASLTLFAVV